MAVIVIQDRVVVSTALVVIDFDDGGVVVRLVWLLHNRHLAAAIAFSYGYRHIGPRQWIGKASLLIESLRAFPLS